MRTILKVAAICCLGIDGSRADLQSELGASGSDLDSPARWELVELSARNPAGTCSITASSLASPEQHRLLVRWTVENQTRGRRGEVALLLRSASIEPAACGGIDTVGFTVEHAFEQGTPKARFLIRQAGKYFVSSPPFSQTSHTGLRLAASDFSEVDTGDTGSTNISLDTESHPDFSRAGPRLEFGVWSFQAAAAQAAGTATTTAFSLGAFSVSVEPIDDALRPFAPETGAPSPPAPRPAAAPGLPNIVIIQCDDLGYGDLSLTGHPAIQSPNIDRLASQGATCTQYYSAANVCSPSRSSLLTGRMPYRLGIYSFIRDAQDYVHLAHDEITLPQVLRQVGYQCANIGKWHVSHLDATEEEDLPTMNEYGFDYWLSSDNNLQILNKDGWWRNHTRVGTIEGYAATVVSDEAIGWLEDSRDPARPFLLFANYYEPHADSEAPPELKEKYAKLGHAAGPARYYACVEHLDQQVGRLLGALDRLGLGDEQTIVLFTSDHGPNPTSTSRFGTAAPFRGTKYEVWDGSTHVPAVIRWPGTVAPGSTIDETIGSIDLLQTLATIAGANRYLPADRVLDGTDFSPLLTGRGQFGRRTPLQWHYYKSSAAMLSGGSPQAALRQGDLVITGCYERPTAFGNVRWMPIPSQNDGIIEMDYITGTGSQAENRLSTGRGTFRLYDLSRDPEQREDLFDPALPLHLTMRDQLIAYHESLRGAGPGWGFRRDAPDYSSYANWLASHSADATALERQLADPRADPDADGYANLLEYALAASPLAKPKRDLFEASYEQVRGENFLTLSFKTSRDSRARLFCEISYDLDHWEPCSFLLTKRRRETDGTYRVFFRSESPVRDTVTAVSVRIRAEAGAGIP